MPELGVILSTSAAIRPSNRNPRASIGYTLAAKMVGAGVLYRGVDLRPAISLASVPLAFSQNSSATARSHRTSSFLRLAALPYQSIPPVCIGQHLLPIGLPR